MTPEIPWWITALASLGVPSMVISSYTIITKFLENRASRHRARELDGREDDRHEEQTFNVTRARAERHIRWDYSLISRIEGNERLINELREKVGLPRIEFEPISAPPPFFDDAPPVAEQSGR